VWPLGVRAAELEAELSEREINILVKLLEPDRAAWEDVKVVIRTRMRLNRRKIG
jgi:hypothetical protein